MTLEFVICLVFLAILFIGYIVLDTNIEKAKKEQEKQETIDLAVDIVNKIKEHE